MEWHTFEAQQEVEYSGSESKSKLAVDEIWVGTGVLLYREGRQSTASISFEKKDVPKVIRFIEGIRARLPGTFGATFSNTTVVTTKMGMRFEDHQGRKLSLFYREIPEAIELLSKYVLAEGGEAMEYHQNPMSMGTGGTFTDELRRYRALQDALGMFQGGEPMEGHNIEYHTEGGEAMERVLEKRPISEIFPFMVRTETEWLEELKRPKAWRLWNAYSREADAIRAYDKILRQGRIPGIFKVHNEAISYYVIYYPKTKRELITALEGSSEGGKSMEVPIGIVRAYKKAQKARREYYTSFTPEQLKDKQVGAWIEGVIWELEKLHPELKGIEESSGSESPGVILGKDEVEAARKAGYPIEEKMERCLLKVAPLEEAGIVKNKFAICRAHIRKQLELNPLTKKEYGLEE